MRFTICQTTLRAHLDGVFLTTCNDADFDPIFDLIQKHGGSWTNFYGMIEYHPADLEGFLEDIVELLKPKGGVHWIEKYYETLKSGIA